MQHAIQALAAAHHESAHAMATVLAFQNATWWPKPRPRQLIRYVEIVEDGPGSWSGCCFSEDIYSPRWGPQRIAPAYYPLMTAQISIHYAGGIAEAIFRGELDRHTILPFAKDHCGATTDMELATPVIADVCKLRGCYWEQPHIDRTLAMLLENWASVQTLADALVQERWIDGHRVQALVSIR